MDKQFAKLIRKCADDMNAAEKRVIEDAQRLGTTYTGPGITTGPSSAGRVICQWAADKMGMPTMGAPAYLLLAYSPNDILDWTDHILGDNNDAR